MANRWFNPRLPQTLVVAQFLLYFDAFWAVLDFLSVSVNSRVSYTFFGRIIAVASIAGYLYGGWGIANERKLGYQVAIAASFLPLAARFVNTLGAGGPMSHLGYILIGGNIVSAMFEYALIVVLLHSQSREHTKIWFS
ncbi:MAG: hypothetical protein M9942_06600 [Microthrixaceae bacterium]|nr:hypothetical protein [Microthrixaceae bacterium]MCO5318092.1 hypothetical protein [Microthrixaceae bacterium]